VEFRLQACDPENQAAQSGGSGTIGVALYGLTGLSPASHSITVGSNIVPCTAGCTDSSKTLSVDGQTTRVLPSLSGKAGPAMLQGRGELRTSGRSRSGCAR